MNGDVCSAHISKPVSRGLIFFGASCLVAFIGWLDHLTACEWSVFVFFSVPIGLVTWTLGTRHGIVVAIFCALTTWVAHQLNHSHRTDLGHALLLLSRAFFFSVVVVAFGAIRSLRDRDRVALKMLEVEHELERQIVFSSEREQQRIGRELHDVLGNHLASVGYAAAFLADGLRGPLPERAAQADQIFLWVQDAGSIVRDIARGIFPGSSDGLDLAAALKDMASIVSKLNRLDVTFLETGDPLCEPPEVGMHLYRIAQEAVQNSLRHGLAQTITIMLNCNAGSLRLTVADDGCGAAPGAARGMGLHLMRHRASIIHGVFTVEFRPGEGTIVTCEIPQAHPISREMAS